VEFRCRLASANGEIVEGVYVAESETRLRHEFDEKGLFVLALRPKGAIAGVSLQLPHRSHVNTREFLVFNQELATLLKAGMPLVQSLDLLRRRVDSPLFRSVLDDVYEKVRSGTALSDAFASHSGLFPRVYAASLVAGERSGNLDAVLRRYVEYTKVVATVKRKTISALVYPAILTTLALVLVSILGVPMLGHVARKLATSQMSRTLATLLGGGLPLVNALDIAARSIGNQYMAAQLDIVSARVREGESFAAALEGRHAFPDVAVKMAEVGESTGALQDMLNTVADFYDEEIATNMERFITLVEPVLLVVMGVVIAGLLLALYMPLFQLSSVLGQ
jgi:type IV pilus assembly protein PilC